MADIIAPTFTDGIQLRKINLTTDIATQAELISVFNYLSDLIGDANTGWQEADVALSGALKEWAKGSELSGALHTEITAETDRATTVENAISNSLTAYALSTTVADAYVLSVGPAAELTTDLSTDADAFRYTFYQGGVEKGHIDVAKDQFVETADFAGTILTLTLRGGQKISTDLGTIADYEGVNATDANVDVTQDHKISVAINDTIARVGDSNDTSAVNTIYGVKAYADAIVAGKNVDAEGDAYVSASAADNKVTVTTSDKVKNAVDYVTATSATWDSALQSISKGTDGTYVTTTIGTKTNNDQTVAVAVTTADLTSDTAGLAVNTDVKQYVDNAVSSKNVSASGDTLVSADAANNAVTIGATSALTAAVELANSAISDVVAVNGTETYILLDRDDDNHIVTLDAVIATDFDDVEYDTTALADAGSIKQYVDGLVGTPLSGVNLNGSALTVTDRTVELSVQPGSANGTIAVNGSDVAVTGLQNAAFVTSSAIQDVVIGTNADTSAANTVYGAKAYADDVVANAVDDLSVTISGDTLVSAGTADGKALTVGATSNLTDAVDKANTAIQSLTGDTDDYVTINAEEVTEGDNTSWKITPVATVKSLNEVTVDDIALADAFDVKSYVDNREVSIATGSTNGTLSVTKGDTTTEVAVAGLQNAAYVTSSDIQNVVIGTNSDTSADNTVWGAKAYADDVLTNFTSQVREAALTMDTDIDEKDVSAYVDIDEVITELESLKAIVRTFANNLTAAVG